MEISEEKVYEAVGKGVSVYHGDIDEGLSYYPDGMFDYVILSQTLQEARETALVMSEALRVGQHVVVSFPNFGHWRPALQLLLTGPGAGDAALPYQWYDTPNIHSLTIKDFRAFTREQGMPIVRHFYVGPKRPSALLAEPVRGATACSCWRRCRRSSAGGDAPGGDRRSRGFDRNHGGRPRSRGSGRMGKLHPGPIAQLVRAADS